MYNGRRYAIILEVNFWGETLTKCSNKQIALKMYNNILYDYTFTDKHNNAGINWGNGVYLYLQDLETSEILKIQKIVQKAG